MRREGKGREHRHRATVPREFEEPPVPPLLVSCLFLPDYQVPPLLLPSHLSPRPPYIVHQTQDAQESEALYA